MAMNSLKRTLYPVIHPLTKSFRPLIRDKTENIDELVAVYDDLDTVKDALDSSKFHRHTFLSTLKYIEIDGQRHWERLSYVRYAHGPFRFGQVHIYIIPVGEKVRVYAHTEWPIFRPVKHQNGKQLPGDTTGLVCDALP